MGSVIGYGARNAGVNLASLLALLRGHQPGLRKGFLEPFRSFLFPLFAHEEREAFPTRNLAPGPYISDGCGSDNGSSMYATACGVVC
jgi:hypothetical protein